MKDLKSYMDEVRGRLAAATPGVKRVERLEGFNEALFRYEINYCEPLPSGRDYERCLVAFYEDNHVPYLRAKFNAELFAHAPADLKTLLEVVETLRDGLHVYSLNVVGAPDAGDHARFVLAECDALAKGVV
jgi:hypothetical protein